MRLVHSNGHVERSLLARHLEQLHPIDRLVICRHLQAVPGQAHQPRPAPASRVFLIPSGCGKPRSPRRISPWRHGEPIKPLAVFGGRNDRIDNARKARVVAQMQPPDPIAGPFSLLPSTIRIGRSVVLTPISFATQASLSLHKSCSHWPRA